MPSIPICFEANSFRLKCKQFRSLNYSNSLCSERNKNNEKRAILNKVVYLFVSNTRNHIMWIMCHCPHRTALFCFSLHCDTFETKWEWSNHFMFTHTKTGSYLIWHILYNIHLCIWEGIWSPENLNWYISNAHHFDDRPMAWDLMMVITIFWIGLWEYGRWINFHLRSLLVFNAGSALSLTD